MNWRLILMLSVILTAIDNALSKRRKVFRIEDLSSPCSKCFDGTHDEMPDGSRPVDRSQYQPHSDLSSSCVACFKFLEKKEKRMNRYNKNHSNNPKQDMRLRADFQEKFEAVTGAKLFHPAKAPAIGTNIHLHLHILKESDSDFQMAQSDFKGIESAANETTQDVDETAQSSSVSSTTANGTPQDVDETTQSSSVSSTTANGTAQDVDETTQSSSVSSTTANGTPQVVDETTQSSSESSTTGNGTTQVVDETTQSSPVLCTTGNETSQVSDETSTESTREDGKQVVTISAIALAVALFLPAPPSFLSNRANVNYDYD